MKTTIITLLILLLLGIAIIVVAELNQPEIIVAPENYTKEQQQTEVDVIGLTINKIEDCQTYFYKNLVYNNTICEQEYNTKNKTYQNVNCTDNYVTVIENETVCEHIGYNVSYKKQFYRIKGSCCGIINNKDEYYISCKQKVADICNYVCQQTSKDKDVYDEYCIFYYPTDKGLIPSKVGSYDYVEDYEIKLTELTISSPSIKEVIKIK